MRLLARVARLEQARNCDLCIGDAILLMFNGDMSALERVRLSERREVVALLEEIGREALEQGNGTPTAASRHPG